MLYADFMYQSYNPFFLLITDTDCKCIVRTKISSKLYYMQCELCVQRRLALNNRVMSWEFNTLNTWKVIMLATSNEAHSQPGVANVNFPCMTNLYCLCIVALRVVYIAMGHNSYRSTEKPPLSLRSTEWKGASVFLSKCPWWERTFVTLSTHASLF